MNEYTEQRIKKHFTRMVSAVFWPSDLSKILNDHKTAWDASSVTVAEFTDFLVDGLLLKRAQFSSTKYPPIIRYLRGTPSRYRVAMALRRDSFLSHATALVLHGLEPSTNTIYVNQEQGPKPIPEDMNQQSIRQAFRNQQRKSQYVFENEDCQYVLLNGKNTDRAGVVRMRAPDGALVNVTDLERTLIDIVVRPAYAGGLKRVISAYHAVADKINLDYLLKLLDKIGYAYPYQQSIGFLLERVGYPEKKLRKIESLRSSFDFFLDYGLKEPSYNERWQIHYPGKL